MPWRKIQLGLAAREHWWEGESSDISCVVLRGFPAKVTAEQSCREWRSQPWGEPGEEGSKKRGQRARYPELCRQRLPTAG